MIKKRPIEVGIVALVLTGLLIYFVLVPVTRILHDINLKTSVKKQELSKKEDKLEGLNQIKSRLSALEGEITTMNNALPKGKDVPGLLTTTEAMVYSAGMTISGFIPSEGSEEDLGESQEGASVGDFSAAISLSGSYPAFVGFLESLENNLRPISVTSLNIAGGASDQPLSINLDVRSYYQKSEGL